MNVRAILGVGMSLVILETGCISQVAAQSRREVNQRVQFSLGSSSTTINGSVPLGRKDTYIFRVRKGQKISVDVTWLGTRVGRSDDQGLSGFTFVEPSGQSFIDPQNNYFQATSTGDHRVVIAQPYQLSSPRYTFKLTIR